MTTHNPIELLFGGMTKLGPGDDAITLEVLHRLPARQFATVVDAGCGSGRQTLALAKELGVAVHAFDVYEPFLADLSRRAEEAGIGHLVRTHEAGIGHLVRTHCTDMQTIPASFHDIDLIWSEGAAYNIGFPNALVIWAPALGRGGFLVASELCWTSDSIPDPVREFFKSGYPGMMSVADNIVAAESSGYNVLFTRELPHQAWVDDYYDVLGPRAEALLDHPDEGVREFARETVREIEIFGQAEDSYGYVFFALQVR
jgi:SAM-dependent methyltransferase